MADTKISALTDGATATSVDRIPVSRAGVNYYVTADYLALYDTGKMVAIATMQALAFQ